MVQGIPDTDGFDEEEAVDRSDDSELAANVKLAILTVIFQQFLGNAPNDA